MSFADRKVGNGVSDQILTELPARELADLYRKLESLPAIEQAKGILMGQYGVDAKTAFRILTRASQAGDVTVRFVAERLTAALNSEPTTDLPLRETIDRILGRDYQHGCAR